MNSDVAGIVLAAGASTRLGQPKQLLPYGDTTLLRHVTRVGLAAGLKPLVVVLGAHAAACWREVADLPVVVVDNPRYAEGQSTSLRAGLAALPAAARAVVVLLGDMPEVDAPLVQQLVATWRATGASIVRPAYAGQPGNPVLFSAEHFPALAAARGDEGGRAVLRAHAAEVLLVPVASPAALEDIDTWEAYQALLRRARDARPLAPSPGGTPHEHHR